MSKFFVFLSIFPQSNLVRHRRARLLKHYIISESLSEQYSLFRQIRRFVRNPVTDYTFPRSTLPVFFIPETVIEPALTLLLINPYCLSVLYSFSALVGSISHRGSLHGPTSYPIARIACFTGIGFTSKNSASINSKYCNCKLSLFSVSPAK